jgi:putative effector of murein hydrolase
MRIIRKIIIKPHAKTAVETGERLVKALKVSYAVAAGVALGVCAASPGVGRADTSAGFL